jgi:hypothetical protein
MLINFFLKKFASNGFVPLHKFSRSFELLNACSLSLLIFTGILQFFSIFNVKIVSAWNQRFLIFFEIFNKFRIFVSYLQLRNIFKHSISFFLGINDIKTTQPNCYHYKKQGKNHDFFFPESDFVLYEVVSKYAQNNTNE